MVPTRSSWDKIPEKREVQAHDPFIIRNYRPEDCAEVTRLYREGLMLGQLDPYDSAVDLEHIEECYGRDSFCHFWVAQADGRLIGTVAIAHDETGEMRIDIAHLRRLRVDPAWQHDDRVAVRLLEVATAHARAKKYLKLVIHTPVDDLRCRAMLERLGFVFARKRQVHGRLVLEFYMHLYRATPSAFES
jgi:N-acetylglutamate synthase-like GNAT family acetyltransferase